MLYTDVLFIALFALLLIGTRLLNVWPQAREWLIICFSLMVLASWGLLSVGLLIAVAAINFAGIAVANSTGDVAKKTIIGCVIALDLSTLILFKYTGFLEHNLDAALHVHLSVPSFGIPLAISFYTFHLISYSVDVARRHTKPLRLRQYLFYLCFFPHLIAGPIIRTWQLAPQLGKIRRIPTDVAIGIHFFVVGFFLKAVIANNLASAIDPVWQSNPGWTLSIADRWVAAFLYYCQIYSDFAGYSLMALGMARLLGYRLPPNFRAPLLAVSMQDFWQRWHRTLSFWLRDYLYIPLGGNRKGKMRGVVNVLVTMLLGGLWHGAGWNFVVWGAMHGIGISGERLIGAHRQTAVVWRRAIWWLVTQIWVTIAWVFFRSPGLRESTDFLRGMFGVSSTEGVGLHASLALGLVIAVGAVAHQLTPFWITRAPRKMLATSLGAATALLVILDLIVYSPNKVFIYFKF